MLQKINKRAKLVNFLIKTKLKFETLEIKILFNLLIYFRQRRYQRKQMFSIFYF